MNITQRNRFTKFIDGVVATFSPTSAIKREIARQRLSHAFRYSGAVPSNSRVQTTQNLQGAESATYQRDRVQLMKEARNLEENGAVANAIIGRFETHVTGNVRWQPQTGSKRVNAAINEWFSHWMNNCDFTGRHSFRKLAQLSLRHCLTDGDCGVIPFVDETMQTKLIGVEGDRIGTPYDTTPKSNYIGGVHLDAKKRPVAYEVYERDQFGQYVNPEVVPVSNFCHFFNSNRFDRFRGISAFAPVIDTAVDIDEIVSFEKMAVKWGSMQTAVVTGSAGGPTSNQFFDDGAEAETTERRRIEEVAPGQINYIDDKDAEIKQFTTDRPHGSWEGFLQFLIRLYAAGVRLPYGFVFDIATARGPGARFEALQADRVFQMWQQDLADHVLNKVKNVALTAALAAGEIPSHRNFLRGRWQFPTHATIDVGRESAADVAEVGIGLKSMATVLRKHALDDHEERERIALETRHWMDLSEQHDVPLELLMGSRAAGASAPSNDDAETQAEANGKGFSNPIIIDNGGDRRDAPYVDVKPSPVNVHLNGKGDDKPVVKKTISLKRARGKIVGAEIKEEPQNGDLAKKRVALSDKASHAHISDNTIVEYKR